MRPSFSALQIALALWAAFAAGARDALAAGSAISADPVKIGLFIPTGGERQAEGREVLRGAEIAAAAVEARGLLAGRPLRLVIGSADGPWGAGTTELTRLIYGEDVWALLGAVDGRSAHLAEQVVTRAKGRVVLVTPWAADPTLTQIQIPWFFRVVPDDRQQMAVLVREMFAVRRLAHVAVLVEEGYDARVSSETFLKAAPTGAVTSYHAGDGSVRPLLGRLRQTEVDGWVFFGRPASAARWLEELREAGLDRPVFAPLALAGREFLERVRGSAAAAGAALVVPGGVQELGGGQFRRDFVGAYGESPGPLAFYAHDGLMVLAEAIRAAGFDREAIREALAGIRLAGVTGPVEFDSSGNRRGGVELMLVERESGMAR